MYREKRQKEVERQKSDNGRATDRGRDRHGHRNGQTRGRQM